MRSVKTAGKALKKMVRQRGIEPRSNRYERSALPLSYQRGDVRPAQAGSQVGECRSANDTTSRDKCRGYWSRPGYKAWVLVEGLGIGQGGWIRTSDLLRPRQAETARLSYALSKLARCTGNDPVSPP